MISARQDRASPSEGPLPSDAPSARTRTPGLNAAAAERVYKAVSHIVNGEQEAGIVLYH